MLKVNSLFSKSNIGSNLDHLLFDAYARFDLKAERIDCKIVIFFLSLSHVLLPSYKII